LKTLAHFATLNTHVQSQSYPQINS